MAAAAKRAHIANLRDHVLNKTDLPEQSVHVPDWDTDTQECWFLVRGLNAKGRAQFQQQILAQQPGRQQQPGQPLQINWERFWADLVILTARDPEDKSLVFQSTDRDALLEKAAKSLEELAKVARRLSGLEDEATANAKSEDQAQ